MPGAIVWGDAFDLRPPKRRFQLIICDPPYGGIVKSKDWDDVAAYAAWYKHCQAVAADNATIVMWGGVGKPGHRPFLEWAAKAEGAGWAGEFITWAKKRAYGVRDKYLFTREEAFILRRGKPVFNIPLLEVKRGYAGYNKDYPAKSEYLRRTNVWTDINELFKGKIHPCQKPDRLYEVLVATHSNPGDWVYDPCAGSCVTARACRNLGRNFYLVEKNLAYIHAAGEVVGDDLP